MTICRAYDSICCIVSLSVFFLHWMVSDNGELISISKVKARLQCACCKCLVTTQSAWSVRVLRSGTISDSWWGSLRLDVTLLFQINFSWAPALQAYWRGQFCPCILIMCLPIWLQPRFGKCTALVMSPMFIKMVYEIRFELQVFNQLNEWAVDIVLRLLLWIRVWI